MDNYNEYIVEVRDCLHNVVVDRAEFEDANTAYRHFRLLDEIYHSNDLITVTLIEPE